MTRVRNESRNQMLAERVDVAVRFFERLRGLLGRANLPSGEGLWIENCNSIHTFFMRFPIDAVFLSKDHTVVKTYRRLKPFRLTSVVLGARSVLELPAGTLDHRRVETGDQIRLEAAK